ncbi:maleylpyruvate isomerase N-terminal domain-containing protein [soil metagenome]
MSIANYLEAGRNVADIVARIPDDQWDRPGLGDWDVRALVGHTCRAFVTVLTYLDQPAATEDVRTPEEYYALVHRMTVDAAEVAERGRQAGAALGADPGAKVHELVEAVTARLATADPDAVITTIVGGMRVGPYIPTRTFELVVHGLDIAAATSLTVDFSHQALADAVTLAARTAVIIGQGPDVLRALTGRTKLPGGFSVV